MRFQLAKWLSPWHSKSNDRQVQIPLQKYLSPELEKPECLRFDIQSLILWVLQAHWQHLLNPPNTLPPSQAWWSRNTQFPSLGKNPMQQFSVLGHNWYCRDMTRMFVSFGCIFPLWGIPAWMRSLGCLWQIKHVSWGSDAAPLRGFKQQGLCQLHCSVSPAPACGGHPAVLCSRTNHWTREPMLITLFTWEELGNHKYIHM